MIKPESAKNCMDKRDYEVGGVVDDVDLFSATKSHMRRFQSFFFVIEHAIGWTDQLKACCIGV